MRAALAQRQRWLIDQKLMERDGHDIVYRANLLGMLRRRELQRVAGQLSGEIGLPFGETAKGERGAPRGAGLTARLMRPGRGSPCPNEQSGLG